MGSRGGAAGGGGGGATATQAAEANTQFDEGLENIFQSMADAFGLANFEGVEGITEESILPRSEIIRGTTIDAPFRAGNVIDERASLVRFRVPDEYFDLDDGAIAANVLSDNRSFTEFIRRGVRPGRANWTAEDFTQRAQPEGFTEYLVDLVWRP